MSIDKSRFNKIVGIVIDNLEGGYYHPQMLIDGRVKDSRYKNSGETMYGIDRKAGGSINTTTAGKKFWGVIDSLDAKHKWKWLYKGGEHAGQLKSLAGDVIYPEYERMSNEYLSDKARKIVDSDDRLTFNFAYATWNGEGWFKKFANKINDSVKNGVTNNDTLINIAVRQRIESENSLISQGGNKVNSVIDKLKDLTDSQIETVKRHPFIPVLVLVGLVGIIYIGINHKKLF